MKFNPKEYNRVIYVIGSLKNTNVEVVANRLRKDMGPDVEIFDSWKSCGPDADDYWRDYEKAKGLTYKEALNSWAARHIFEFDDFHLQRATDVVAIMPFGKSGNLELGVSLGRGKRGYILFNETPERYDVMLGFCTDVFFNYEDLVVELKNPPTLPLPANIEKMIKQIRHSSYDLHTSPVSEQYIKGYEDAIANICNIIKG
jgi:hypothetical protein